jgi:hypothetical protein
VYATGTCQGGMGYLCRANGSKTPVHDHTMICSVGTKMLKSKRSSAGNRFRDGRGLKDEDERARDEAAYLSEVAELEALGPCGISSILGNIVRSNLRSMYSTVRQRLYVILLSCRGIRQNRLAS